MIKVIVRKKAGQGENQETAPIINKFYVKDKKKIAYYKNIATKNNGRAMFFFFDLKEV